MRVHKTLALAMLAFLIAGLAEAQDYKGADGQVYSQQEYPQQWDPSAKSQWQNSQTVDELKLKEMEDLKRKEQESYQPQYSAPPPAGYYPPANPSPQPGANTILQNLPGVIQQLMTPPVQAPGNNATRQGGTPAITNPSIVIQNTGQPITVNSRLQGLEERLWQLEQQSTCFPYVYAANTPTLVRSVTESTGNAVLQTSSQESAPGTTSVPLYSIPEVLVHTPSRIVLLGSAFVVDELTESRRNELNALWEREERRYQDAIQRGEAPTPRRDPRSPAPPVNINIALEVGISPAAAPGTQGVLGQLPESHYPSNSTVYGSSQGSASTPSVAAIPTRTTQVPLHPFPNQLPVTLPSRENLRPNANYFGEAGTNSPAYLSSAYIPIYLTNPRNYETFRKETHPIQVFHTADVQPGRYMASMRAINHNEGSPYERIKAEKLRPLNFTVIVFPDCTSLRGADR